MADGVLLGAHRGAVEGNLSIIDFHYLVGTPEEGVRHFTERHALAMFAVTDFAEAAASACLSHEYIDHEPFKRGLHVFRQPA